MAKDAPGMKGNRSRTNDGPLRKKRGDTHMKTIENQYDRDFGVKGNMRLDAFLKKIKLGSLNDLIESNMGKK
jgi:hypothetical protein